MCSCYCCRRRRRRCCWSLSLSLSLVGAGVAAVGRAVPFGVGAALGYGINSRTVGMVSDHTHTFFTEFPIALSAIDVDPL